MESQDKIATELQGASLNIVTPKTYKQAITSPEKSDWEDAIHSELCNMRDMGVYDILPILRATHVLGGGWVFVKKPVTKNTPVRFKARYIARGNRQMENEYN
ncbi:hypothetical protein O181_083932 [Austropuccinia psidii MF-1]|uniref:Reverse transcriptase Ty1/copia-type domain-containing protein n=1 Tax=Austropuccinia psidii MF-1 TaxID=1389203 RepID=A0A9Q3FVB7_9BASI|nr:hypothetical protein [Austropuccinia psidii MF-1]